MITTDVRPLRADARRNRRRIVNAARALLTESGFLVQMDELAVRAEVSVGTLYRHFPSKDHLIAALIGERFDEFAAEMELAWREVGSGREPFEAMAAGLWRCAEISAGDVSVQDALLSASEQVGQIVRAGGSRLQEITEKLIRTAIAAGTVRADATTQDVNLLMVGITATQRPRSPSVRPGDWRRHMELALDALRASGR